MSWTVEGYLSTNVRIIPLITLGYHFSFSISIAISGRVSFFTSGSENLHHVEKVYSGTRYAVTISFTCDPERAISDPELPGKN